MASELKNYIPVNRKLFKHEFWTEKRTFSRLEAWLDLLIEARYENAETRRLIGNQYVKWKRGELVASLRFLAERWDWSKNKVDGFIKLLKNEGMITTRTAEGTVQTIITICKYDDYNSSLEKIGQLQDSTGTVPGQLRDETNKEEESKERKSYTHDAEFEGSILKFFGFNQIRNPDKQSTILAFCTVMHNTGRLEHFKQQFIFYEKYIGLIGTKYRKGFVAFLGEQKEGFTNSYWDNENWAQKYNERRTDAANVIQMPTKKTIDHSNRK